METVKNNHGVEFDLAVAVNLMDDALREELHNSRPWASGDGQRFFDEYAIAHLAKFKEPWVLTIANPVY